MFCSNCGQELAQEAKFCSNCGAPVESGASSETPPGDSSATGSERDWGGYSADPNATQEQSAGSPPPPPQASNQPYTGAGFGDRKPDWERERERVREDADDEWAMSNLGPPKVRPRRTWLWILLGMIALVVIACCGFMGWIAFTDSGTEWAENVVSTSEAMLTQEAATPVP